MSPQLKNSDSRSDQKPADATAPVSGIGRIGYFLLGCFMTLLGIIGALLPIMPTTVFLIMAAWAFGRSSPRLEAWLLNHPQFGPPLRGWRNHGIVSRRAKWMACSGIASGYIIFFVSARPSLWLAIFVALFMGASAAWLITRPESPRDQDEE